MLYICDLQMKNSLETLTTFSAAMFISDNCKIGQLRGIIFDLLSFNFIKSYPYGLQSKTWETNSKI